MGDIGSSVLRPGRVEPSNELQKSLQIRSREWVPVNHFGGQPSCAQIPPQLIDLRLRLWPLDADSVAHFVGPLLALCLFESYITSNTTEHDMCLEGWHVFCDGLRMPQGAPMVKNSQFR